MRHQERKAARRYDTPGRCRQFTSLVYSGASEDRGRLMKEVYSLEKGYYPPKPDYSLYYGEMHGHSNLSDGIPTADEYFRYIRDVAGLDFAALTDHDHGGVGKPELYGEKWEYIKEKVKAYNEPGVFSTLLAYERDSYPWYNNMIVYYGNQDSEMFRWERDGELDSHMLSQLLKREDIFIVPHDTYCLEAGTDFSSMPAELYPPLIEIYSRGDSAEYFGNPLNESELQCEGGFWQDALRRGARMGCIAGSDDHQLHNGMIFDGEPELLYGGISKYPGITGVWAEENTQEAIFDALRKRRCYGFMGGRIAIDFRINGHYMGEEFDHQGDREIYFRIQADAPLKCVTIVKNCRDYIKIRREQQFLYDYRAESDVDHYYLRVELEDGRCGWTSPIWVRR